MNMVSLPLKFRAKDSVDHGKNEPSASTKEIDDKGKATPDNSEATVVLPSEQSQSASKKEINDKDKAAPDCSEAMVVLPSKQSQVTDRNVVT